MTYLRRRRRGVVAALVVAGVFLGLFAALEGLQAHGAAPPGTAVLVATRDIGVGQALTRDMVRVWLAPAGAPLGDRPALATDLSRVLGHRVLAPILADEPLSQARLAGMGADTSVVAAASLPRGYARYTLPVGPLAEPLPGLSVGDAVEVLAAVPCDPASPDITQTVQPVDPHAVVAAVQASPAAVTLVVPRSELAALAWLRGQHATFSFALVGPTDRTGDLRGVGVREFRRRYHAPSD